MLSYHNVHTGNSTYQWLPTPTIQDIRMPTKFSKFLTVREINIYHRMCLARDGNTK